jgi:hypothetical protein
MPSMHSSPPSRSTLKSESAGWIEAAVARGFLTRVGLQTCDEIIVLFTVVMDGPTSARTRRCARA